MSFHTHEDNFIDAALLPCICWFLVLKQDFPLTVYVNIWKILYQQASTILTALCSASTLLIVSLGLFGLCQKLFANPLITEVILWSFRWKFGSGAVIPYGQIIQNSRGSFLPGIPQVASSFSPSPALLSPKELVQVLWFL